MQYLLLLSHLYIFLPSRICLHTYPTWSLASSSRSWIQYPRSAVYLLVPWVPWSAAWVRVASRTYCLGSCEHSPLNKARWIDPERHKVLAKSSEAWALTNWTGLCQRSFRPPSGRTFSLTLGMVISWCISTCLGCLVMSLWSTLGLSSHQFSRWGT